MTLNLQMHILMKKESVNKEERNKYMKKKKNKALLTLGFLTAGVAFLLSLGWAWVTYHDAYIFWSLMFLSFGYPLSLITYNKYEEYKERNQKYIKMKRKMKRQKEKKIA